VSVSNKLQSHVRGHRYTGLILRNILDCTGGDIYGERGARAYNGGRSGAEPLVRGSGGEAPLKLTAF